MEGATEKGYAKGKADERIEIAKSMLADGDCLVNPNYYIIFAEC